MKGFIQRHAQKITEILHINKRKRKSWSVTSLPPMISAPAPQPLTGTKIAPFSVLMNIQWKILETLQMDWFNKIFTLKGGKRTAKRLKTANSLSDFYKERNDGGGGGWGCLRANFFFFLIAIWTPTTREYLKKVTDFNENWSIAPAKARYAWKSIGYFF